MRILPTYIYVKRQMRGKNLRKPIHYRTKKNNDFNSIIKLKSLGTRKTI